METQFDNVAYTDISVQRKLRAYPINEIKSRGRLYRLIIISVLMIISIVLIISCFSVSTDISSYQKQYIELSLAINNIIFEKQEITQSSERMKKRNNQLQIEISKIETNAKSSENKVVELKKENDNLLEELSKLQKESDDMDKKIERLKNQIKYYSEEIQGKK